MTIKEFISLPEMENISCVAADNFLDEEISGCGVMEFEESIRWVKRGELVLTSGNIFETDILLQRQIVAELKECGCCGLGIKIRGVLKSVPEAMIEEAEKQQLPLLAIPFYYSFAQISKIIYQRSFQNSLTAAERGELLLNKLGKIFFSHQGLEAMLRLLSEETGYTFLVTDIQYGIIALYASGEYENVFRRGKDTRLEPVWNSSFFAEGGKKSETAFRYSNFRIDGIPYRFFVQALPDYRGCLCIPVEQGELDAWMRQAADKSSQSSHGGTVHMEDRHDALMAAAEVMLELEKAAKAKKTAVVTVGCVDVKPGSINTVPGNVEFTVDVRDISPEVRDGILKKTYQTGQEICERRGVAMEFFPFSAGKGWVSCSERIQELLKEITEEQGMRPCFLASMAGHDSSRFASLCPTGMIFVRSKDGKSFCKEEWSSREDCALGAEILCQALIRLAR